MSIKMDFDIGKNEPPKQEGAVFEGQKYSCFGYSLQGASHVDMDVPCQDFNDFKYVEGADVIVAAIADGVGSCPLSHWGSYTAVKAAIDYTEKEIEKLSRGKKLTLAKCPEMPIILSGAFSNAVDLVEDLADQQNRPVSAFMSTLTLVVYDGANLCCQHIGDDGVVAQFMDGSVEMVTQRIKGEEASSVYPLQSDKRLWQFSKAGADERGPVVAFVMATDGVLDAFVMGNDAYADVEGCCGGVYYPFMEKSVYAENNQHKTSPRKAEEALSYYLGRMKSNGYREQVTDDLTLVSIINLMAVKRGSRPFFDKKAFDDVTREIRERQKMMLYSGKNTEFESVRRKSAVASIRQKTDRETNGGTAKGFKHKKDTDDIKFADIDRKTIVCLVALFVIVFLLGIIVGLLSAPFFLGGKDAADNGRQPSAGSSINAEPPLETNEETEKPPLQDDVLSSSIGDNSTNHEELEDDSIEEGDEIEESPQEASLETEKSSLPDNVQSSSAVDNPTNHEKPADDATEAEVGKEESSLHDDADDVENQSSREGTN